MARAKLVFHSARTGDLESLASLLDRSPPAPTTYKDAAGSTALHKACAEGHFPCVKILIEKGADVDAVNHELASPIHMAALSGSVESLHFLLEAGADRDARDIKDQTPLHYAVANRHVEAVALLLAYGADMGGTILPGGDLPYLDPSGLFRPVQQLAVLLALSRVSALSALSVSAAKGKLEESLRFLDDPDEPHSRLRALLDERRLSSLQRRAGARRSPASSSSPSAASSGTAPPPPTPQQQQQQQQQQEQEREEVVPKAVRALARAEVLLSCARIAYLDAAIKTAQSLGCALGGPASALRGASRRGRGGGVPALSSSSDDDDDDDDDGYGDECAGGDDAGGGKRQRKALFAAVMCVGRWGRMLEEQDEWSRDAEFAARYLEQVQKSVREVLDKLWRRRWLRPLLEN